MNKIKKQTLQKKYDRWIFLSMGILFMLAVLIHQATFIFEQKISSIKEQVASIQADRSTISSALLDTNWQEAQAQLQSTQSKLAEIKDSLSIVPGANKILTQVDDIIVQTTDILPYLEQIKKLPAELASSITINKSEAGKSAQALEEILQKSTSLVTSIQELETAIANNLAIQLSATQLSTVQELQSEFAKLSPYLELANRYIPAVKELLGVDRPHRTLVLLQNSAEIRPGGGFIGSVILIDTNDGAITKFQPIDTHEIDGQVAELRLFVDEYIPVTEAVLSDSNTSPSFAVTGEKVTSVFEKAGWPTVDTVLAVNVDVLEDILQITGPIQTPAGLLTSANAQVLLNYQITVARSEASPKNILFESMPVVIEQVIEQLKSKPQEFVAVIGQVWQKKSVQLFSHKDAIQDFAEFLEIANTYQPLPQTTDELLISHTAIGNNKTDPYQQIRYIHTTELAHNEKLVNHLTVRQYHSFTDTTEAQLVANLRANQNFIGITERELEILGKGTSKIRYKVYVPAGAKLINTQGNLTDVIEQKAHDLDDRTLFIFTTEVQAGHTNEATITYEIPAKLKIRPIDQYSVLVHKSPGVNKAIFQKEYRLVDDIYIRDSQPLVPLLYKGQEYKHEEPLLKDTVYSVQVSR